MLKKDLSTDELDLFNQLTKDKKLDRQLKKEIVKEAVKKNYIKLVKYMYKLRVSWNLDILKEAVINGSLDCLKFLHVNSKKTWLKNDKKKFCKWQKNCKSFVYRDSDNITLLAAHYGKLNCLKYLCENGFEYDAKTFAFAALNNQLKCLKYLREIKCPIDEYASIHAAYNGHLDILKYLCNTRCKISESAASNAALKGHLVCLKYLYEKKKKICCSAAACAGKGGHLECLKFVWDKISWRDEAEYKTASGGNLECLKFMFDNRKEETYYDDSCDGADMLGGAWADSRLLRCAVTYGGSLECVKFLHDIGCPWDKNIYSWTYDVSILKYLYENEQNWNPNPFSADFWKCKRQGHSICTGNHSEYEFDSSATQISAREGSLKRLKYLHEIGYCWSQQYLHMDHIMEMLNV